MKEEHNTKEDISVLINKCPGFPAHPGQALVYGLCTSLMGLMVSTCSIADAQKTLIEQIYQDKTVVRVFGELRAVREYQDIFIATQDLVDGSKSCQIYLKNPETGFMLV